MKKKSTLLNIFTALTTVFVVSQVQAATVDLVHNGDTNVTVLTPREGSTIEVRCSQRGAYTRKRYRAEKVTLLPSQMMVILVDGDAFIMPVNSCSIGQ